MMLADAAAFMAWRAIDTISRPRPTSKGEVFLELLRLVLCDEIRLEIAPRHFDSLPPNPYNPYNPCKKGNSPVQKEENATQTTSPTQNA